jgi:hypothetical protein
MSELTSCPACGITWEGEDIADALMATGNYPCRIAAEEEAGNFGWSRARPKKFGINHVGIVDPAIYDGVSSWKCLGCGHIEPRSL